MASLHGSKGRDHLRQKEQTCLKVPAGFLRKKKKKKKKKGGVGGGGEELLVVFAKAECPFLTSQSVRKLGKTFFPLQNGKIAGP